MIELRFAFARPMLVPVPAVFKVCISFWSILTEYELQVNLYITLVNYQKHPLQKMTHDREAFLGCNLTNDSYTIVDLEILV